MIPLRSARRFVPSCCGAIVLLLAAGALRAQEPSCAAPIYHRLDFWVGEWRVTTPDGKDNGRSVVQRIADGCALLENYFGPMTPQGAFIGNGIHIYDDSTSTWRQYFVDNRPALTPMVGQFVGDTMVYSWETRAAGGKTVLHKYTLSVTPEGTVRQTGTASRDGGTTWRVGFDLVYHRMGG